MGRGLRQAGRFDSRGDPWRFNSPHHRRQRRRIAELGTTDCTLSGSPTWPSGTHRRRLEGHDEPRQARHGSRDEPAQTSLSCLRAEARAACPRSHRPRPNQARRHLDGPANLADKAAPRRGAALHRRPATTPLRTAAILTDSSELSPAARVNLALARSGCSTERCCGPVHFLLASSVRGHILRLQNTHFVRKAQRKQKHTQPRRHAASYHEQGPCRRSRMSDVELLKGREPAYGSTSNARPAK
jgi:hypothetical protein